MYMHCKKSLQIYGLHTNANQNLALMCEVSLLNRTKRAEQRLLWEGQWQERNYAVASLGHHLLMCSSMPECRQHCRRKLIRDSAEQNPNKDADAVPWAKRPVFQTLPSNASTDRVSLLISKLCTEKSSLNTTYCLKGGGRETHLLYKEHKSVTELQQARGSEH